MPIEITVPRLGWSMEEAIFSAWLKQDGGAVKAGDLLFSIESDKATQEIESLDAGVLHIPPDAPKQGDKVLVGQLLGYLLAEGESAPSATSELKPSEAKSSAVITASEFPISEQARKRTDGPVSTPRARRAARELGIDWSQIPGTGRDGRVREADVRARASSGMSPTRRLIAGRMLASQQKTAAVTLHTTADASELVRLREGFKSTNAAMVPTYNDMLLKLTALALRSNPTVNSCWDGDQLRTSEAIHIGLAVDTDAGLLVPVVRNVEKLHLDEIAERSRHLIARARAGEIRGDEIRGGTFTITSLGSFGIDAFTPIINYPECAILGVGRIQRQPVAADDMIALCDVITLSLTFDHRAFDGAPAARFLQTLVRLIEKPKLTA